MSHADLSLDHIRSIERFDAAFQIARMKAAQDRWPELGIQFKEFGRVTAVRMKPAFFKKNLVVGFSKAEISKLPEIVAYFRAIESRFVLTLPYGGMNDETFDALAKAGLKCDGAGHVMAIVPTPQSPHPDVHVRSSPPEEKDQYLDLYRHAFSTERNVSRDEMEFQWLNDTLPGARRFVAEIDGHFAGMASTNIQEGAGYLSTGGVLFDFRGRGVHQALIRARVSAAHDAGCSIVMGGGAIFSRPMRNFSRCGFSLLPLGESWWLPS